MDVAVSDNQQTPDSKRVRVAERVARDVIDADPAVLSLLVLDQRRDCRILKVARSPNLRPEDYADPALIEKFAIAATVVWSSAENAARLMGRREFIVGAFKGQLVLLIDLREFEMLLAIRLNRSSNAEHLYGKIVGLLGLR